MRGRSADVHANFIDGADRAAEVTFELRTPIDRNVVLGRFADATRARSGSRDGGRESGVSRLEAHACRRAQSHLCGERPQLIEERVYDISAAVALEVGKNRMEALGEVQETADFFTVYCDDYERQKFDHALPDDPLPDYRSHNRSVMKPYGVWGVITPFNFPFALAGGPVAAALVTGNTVVLKGATDTPWSGRMLADCLRDAGIPAGVFNYICGSGSGAGEALVNHPDTRGHHVHRLPCGGHADSSAHGSRRVAAAVHRRDGRQESGHRERGRGPGPRHCWHRALCVRAQRAEVLRRLARVRA